MQKRIVLVEQTSPRDLFRRAIGDLGSSFDRADVRSWFQGHAMWIDPLTVEGLTIAATVNDRRRQHFPAPDDLLYANGDGSLRPYDPQAHGPWTKLGTPGRASDLEPPNLARLLKPRAGTHLIWGSHTAA